MRTSTLRLVVCASLAAVVLGQRPLPGLVGQGQDFIPLRQQNLIPQRQLVNQGFRGQDNQGFGGQLNQGFGAQQNIISTPPVRAISRPVAPVSQQVIINQHTDIIEDIRDGPFWDGSYYFRYQTADGTIREEGGRPNHDGSMLVTGSYGYRAPNGEVFEMEYIADANGYRAFPRGSRADFVPPQRAVAPQGSPPIFDQNFVGGGNIVLQPQPRPVARPRPINTQTLNRPVNNQIINPSPIQAGNNNFVRPGNNQIINPSPIQGNNNFLRPGNNFNTVNNIRPAPGNFQGFGANTFGQVNRNGQDNDLSGSSSDDTFVAVESPEN